MKKKTVLTGFMILYLLLGAVSLGQGPNQKQMSAFDMLGINRLFERDSDGLQVQDDGTDNDTILLIGTPEFEGDVSDLPKPQDNTEPPTVQQPTDNEPDRDAPDTSMQKMQAPEFGRETIPARENEPKPEGKPAPVPNNNATQEGISLADYAAEVVRLVNEARAAQGMNALVSDPAVNAAAQTRAREQATSFSHTRPNGQSAFTALAEAKAGYRGAGENIAMGQSTPEQAMNGWMSSDGHRANILNSRFTKIGVGCFRDSNGTYYWTQLFTH